MSLVANNSIGWACLQMSGGWRRIMWVCATIAVGIPLILFGSLQLNDPDRPAQAARTLSGWYMMLGVLQGGLLMIGMPSRVHAAIKRDRVGKLYESHRLMPAPDAHAIAGYIVGANLFLLGCIATVFAIGAFIAVPAQQDVRGWIALHAAGLGISAMLCCIVAFTTQWLPKFNPALILLFLGPTVGGVSVTFLPPMRVLFAPYVGSGFAQLQQGQVETVHVIAFAAQAAIAAVLFIGACRRYRRDDVPALGFLWGVVLLALWVGLTLIGIRAVEPDRFGPFGREQPDRIAYVVAVTLSMALAIGPIASAATAGVRYRERKRIDAYLVHRRPLPLAFAGLLVAMVLGALLLCAPGEVGTLGSRYGDAATSTPVLLTGVQIALFVVTVALLAHGAAVMRLPTAWLTLPWLFLTWMLVPALDGLTTVAGGAYGDFPHAMSAASPPFCLGFIWGGQQGGEAQIGLVAQAALVGVLYTLWLFLKRSNRASAIEAKLVAAGE